MVQELKTHKKIVIGLTGAFGSGKSTVANFFRELGAFVVDADQLAHEALAKDSPVFGEFEKMFQNKLVIKDSGIDRKWLAAVVFNDEQTRKRVEAFVHPYVFSRIAEEINGTDQPATVVEVPLLYESGFDRLCDHVVAVKATPEQIRSRLSQKGFSPEEVKKRQQAQMPLVSKLEKADFVVDNSGDFEKTKKEVERIWKKITHE